MKNIIEELYFGELCPAEEDPSALKEYEQVFERKQQLKEKFYKNFSEKETEEYDALMEEYFMISQKERSKAFCQGFQTAVKLILQALQ